MEGSQPRTSSVSTRISESANTLELRALVGRAHQNHAHLDASAVVAHAVGGVTRNLSEAQRYICDEVCKIRPTVREPWIDARGHVMWDSWRVRVGRVMQDKRVEQGLACIILFNVGVIYFETNQEAKCFPEHRGDLESCETSGMNFTSLTIINNSLLVLYSLEALLNIYALRSEYFRRVMCLFDLAICLGGWASLVLGSVIKVSWLRILRCGRVLKALHFITSIPELYMLFTGFLGSMKAMFFGGVILAGLLCFFSILTVQLIHPVAADISDCPSCARAFDTIERSMLTLFQQIVAGDSWGLVSIPIIENNKIGLLLPFIQLVIGVGAMNLILAVVVDRAVEARETNKEQLVLIKAEDQKIRKLELLDLVRKMDANRNGMIDHDEILNAAKNSNDFMNRLRLVGVSEKELKLIVDAIEERTTGEFGYLDFCNALDDVEASDIRKTVVLTKMQVAVVRRILVERMDAQDRKLEKIQTQMAELLRQQSYGTNGRFRSEDMAMPIVSEYHTDDFVGVSYCSSDYGLTKIHSSRSTTTSCPSPTNHQRCAFTEEIVSCQARVLNVTAQLRQTLGELDTCWKKACQIAQKASSGCMEARAPAGANANQPERDAILYRHLMEQFSSTQRDLQLRRNQFIEDLTKEFEDHIVSLVQHCNLCCSTSAPLVQDSNHCSTTSAAGDTVNLESSAINVDVLHPACTRTPGEGKPVNHTGSYLTRI